MNRSLAARLRPQALPLRWRLTLVCVAVLAAILAVFGAVLYKDVERAIVDTTATSLRNSARPTINQYLRPAYMRATTPTNPPDGSTGAAPLTATDRALTDIARTLTSRVNAARTTDADGVTLGDGPTMAGMTDLSAPLLDAAIYREVAASREERHWRAETPSGPIVIELIPLTTGVPGQPAIGVLQLSTSLRTGEAVLEELRNQLLLGTLIATLATVVLTLPLIRGVLAPMRRMSATSRAIAAGDLSRRVDVPAGGDALADLALSFNDMVGKLDEAFATQRRFIADASHELRTPLTALGSGVEMLQMGVDKRDPEAREKLLRLMSGEIGRMGRLVDGLLTLSNLDRDPARALQRTSVDLATLAAGVVDETRLLAPDRYVELIAPRGALKVQGDADKLRQVLLNLCTNARAHTPPDGTITISLGREGERAILAVADSGVGIPPDALERVWDRFFRVEAARERKNGAGGLGLGLAIVRAIVEAHGGDVAIASSVGVGTTVTIALPLDAPQGAALEPEATRPAAAKPEAVRA